MQGAYYLKRTYILQINMKVNRQIHRLQVARVLEQATQAGNANDLKKGQQILQTAIDTINADAPKDEYCQKYVWKKEYKKKEKTN